MSIFSSLTSLSYFRVTAGVYGTIPASSRPDRAAQHRIGRRENVLVAEPGAALALSAFLPKHAAIFKADTFAPVCESYFDDEDREVRFTVPYEAFDLFDIDESADQDRGALPSDPAKSLRRHRRNGGRAGRPIAASDGAVPLWPIP